MVQIKLQNITPTQIYHCCILTGCDASDYGDEEETSPNPAGEQTPIQLQHPFNIFSVEFLWFPPKYFSVTEYSHL
jgi:hypothetical protein